MAQFEIKFDKNTYNFVCPLVRQPVDALDFYGHLYFITEVLDASLEEGLQLIVRWRSLMGLLLDICIAQVIFRSPKFGELT